MVKPGDVCQLTFDGKIIPKNHFKGTEIRPRSREHQTNISLSSNKPEGMKTHGNQPGDATLLNHVSPTLVKPAMSFMLDMETSSLSTFAGNPFYLTPSQSRFWKKEMQLLAITGI